MNPRGFGYITYFAHGEREGDSFPGAVGAEVHASEGEVFHYFPGDDGGVAETAVEFEAVMQDALGKGGVERVVEFGRFGLGGFHTGHPAGFTLLAVGSVEDVYGGASWGARDFDFGEVIVGGGREGAGKTEGGDVVVVVAAVEFEHCFTVEFESGPLGFAYHPD